MAVTKYSRGIAAFSGLNEGRPRPNVAALEAQIQASEIIVALDHTNWIGDTEVADLYFKSALDASNVAILDTVVAAHDGEPLQTQETTLVAFDPEQTPLTDDLRLRVGVEKSTQSKAQFYSHDWCDPTTWYEDATRVVDQAATDSGDHITYTLPHENLIDVCHAKITQEDFLLDSEGNSFRVVVEVDGVEKTEQDPHTGTGGDFVVDYEAGEISFVEALTGTEAVTATYHYATTALFTIKPLAGRKLLLEMVEVQFSDDIEIADTLRFQGYGLVEVFAPQLVDNPYPAGTLIPLGDPIVYKSMRDYFNDAQRAYPSYPAIGGAGWRGMPRPSYILDWDYLRGTLLESSKGMEIRVTLDHDQKFGGAFATATFYCSCEPE